MKWTILFALWLLCSPLPAQDIQPPIHHELKVTLQPKQRSLTVTDRITLPKPVESLTLHLHAGLKPRFFSDRGDVSVDKLHSDNYLERYRITLPDGVNHLQVEYAGTIHHALSSTRAEQSRGFRSSAGLIAEQGVFLSSGTLWYPQIEGHAYLTYSMQVELPAGWSSVSQGKREQHQHDRKLTRDRWYIKKPQEEIYLIAAQFTEYQRAVQLQQGTASAQVFLREPDQKLADKYLDATIGYLKMYEELLGPYAYSKFALVENFWETGFGMPSFTLLGSRVIRLPFILNSSYPHEILHNWWGNGVYVDFATGNWSEGLTAYLADHLIKEQQEQGVNYRQQSLQKYRDYAAKNRDFPLTQFKSRHSSATEAVGYGKTLMLFHMLRKQLGDKAFIKALQKLYKDYQFRIASFNDVQQVFEQVSGESLKPFFNQWVTRTGAPELVLKASRVEKISKRFRLQLTLKQVQPGDPYILDIPVAVSLNNQRSAKEVVLAMTAREQIFELDLPASPTRVDIDPQFDLFRKLAIAETPPAFTQLFGASDLLVVLPGQAKGDMNDAWRAFAQDVSHMGPERVSIVTDDEIESLPEDKAVVVLGWDNHFASQIQSELARHPVTFKPGQVDMGQAQTEKKHHAFAWVTRFDGTRNQSHPRALITADLPGALAGLGRKIPHYHKYSYLAFAGEEPENRLKGRWPVTDSPMTEVFQKGAERAELQSPAALIDPVSVFDAARMMKTIRALSNKKLQGRGLGSPGLEQSADYIADAFKKAGLKPGGDDGSYYQSFSAMGEDGKPRTLKNVIGVIPGRHPKLSAQNLVFGAHYDHLGLGWPDVREQNRGKVHSGADDNASGIAVMLELARVLGRKFHPDRTIVFTAFSGEEAGRLGSKHYVKHEKHHPVSKAIAMLNLDTVGRLFDNKLMVLGAESAAEWPHIFRGIGFVTGISSVMAGEPLDTSDQISFHEAGVPAVQLFSGAHTDYHRPGDTADKIDTDGLLKVAEVSKQVLEYLAAREEPMTRQLGGSRASSRTREGRKVSLGTIPDFAYQGEGYRLDGVVPGSPAAQAGLEKMDIIVSIDDRPIKGIRDISTVLKSLKPGQMISIRYLRNGNQHQTQAELKIK
ncbi:MAG: M20/M25/M40 family metallo-hydrolase [Candidatus Thiodiazotropha sp. (ex Monitilora ramsayi)]|nr:M20/M25/M40 family metallo-hydrolase [Candidatus Thiodiazotropha sp. (ex Monitilora ramsayi)]